MPRSSLRIQVGEEGALLEFESEDLVRVVQAEASCQALTNLAKVYDLRDGARFADLSVDKLIEAHAAAKTMVECIDVLLECAADEEWDDDEIRTEKQEGMKTSGSWVG